MRENQPNSLTIWRKAITLSRMTTTPERRTATLSELVAEEIRALLGRRRMSQAQLARGIGKTEMWISLRLRGKQPIDLDDLELIARLLDVPVQDLFPASRPAGRGGAGPDLNASSGQLIRMTVPGPPPVRTGRHVVSGISPIGSGRRDPTRPVSAIPAMRRRPTQSGPGKQPMAV